MLRRAFSLSALTDAKAEPNNVTRSNTAKTIFDTYGFTVLIKPTYP